MAAGDVQQGEIGAVLACLASQDSIGRCVRVTTLTRDRSRRQRA